MQCFAGLTRHVHPLNPHLLCVFGKTALHGVNLDVALQSLLIILLQRGAASTWSASMLQSVSLQLYVPALLTDIC